MSKGLEALNRIGNMPTQNNMGLVMINTLRDYEIIEKELEANELAIEFIDNIANQFDEHDLDELADKIVKVKKALDIIKEKKVSICMILPSTSFVEYNSFMVHKHRILTQEEYDLLKEVLNDESNTN